MVGLGGHYRLTDDVALTLETTVQGTTGWGSWPIEAMAGSRFRLKGGVWGTAGVGAGLNDHTGTSSMRVVAGLGWNKRVEEREVEFIGWFIDPDRDRDGDGFKDLDDACPDQAETVDGFLDDDGCPELDGDADGVPFERDLCPREPIYVEQDPRFSDGCPKIAELAGNRITVTESIFFEENSTRLMPKSDAPLEAIFHELEAHQEVRHLLIEGHTNSNGSASFNYRLGRLRAESVLVWLEKRGVDRNRLIAKGYGFDVPLLPHDHPDATEMNRRVVFLVLRPEGDPGPEPAQTVFPQFSLESEKAATGPIRILEFEGMDFPPEKGAPPREPSASSAVEAPASGSVIAPAEESLPGVSIETVPVEVPEEPAVPVEAPDEEAAGPSEEAMQPAEEASPEPDDLGDLEEDTGRASLFGRRNRSSDESSAPAEEADPPAEEPKPEEPAPDTTPAPQ